MDSSPLETAVRGRLKESMSSIVGSRPEMDEAALNRMVDEKAAMVLPILRESLMEDATPSLDLIHQAELEATKRKIRTTIGWMTDPAAQAIVSKAAAELAATPAPAPPPDLLADEIEARLAELEKRLNPALDVSGDAGETTTPQSEPRQIPKGASTDLPPLEDAGGTPTPQ